MSELHPELEVELEFLLKFQALHQHVFEVKNNKVDVLGVSYYPFFETTDAKGNSLNTSEDVVKKLNGERMIISIPNVTAKIFELQNPHLYKKLLFKDDYATKLICRGIASKKNKMRRFYKDHEYDINEWYREDYHFVNNLKLL